MIVLLQLQLSVSRAPKDLWTSSVRFVLFAIANSRAWVAIDPQCGAARRGACLAYNSRSAVRAMQRTPHECTDRQGMSAVRSGFPTVDSNERSFLVRRQRCAPGVCAKEGRSILLGDGPHISTRAAGSRRPPRQAAHTMYVARCMLHAICCTLHIASCMSHVACCTLYAARCAGLRNPPAQLPFHICPGPGHSPSSISVPLLRACRSPRKPIRTVTTCALPHSDQFRRRCGSGESTPGADVAWQG